MADRKNDQAPTELFDDLKWLPPVATTDLLPTEGELREGHLCFVIGEGAIYEWKEGTWVNTQAEKDA